MNIVRGIDTIMPPAEYPATSPAEQAISRALDAITFICRELLDVGEQEGLKLFAATTAGLDKRLKDLKYESWACNVAYARRRDAFLGRHKKRREVATTQ
jgi:hypothetical protein